MIASGERARARWSVTFRVLAGTLGAYGLTSLFTVVLSLLLAAIGMNRFEAVTAATLCSYAVFAATAIGVFHARSAKHALIGLAVAASILGLAAGLLTCGAIR